MTVKKTAIGKSIEIMKFLSEPPYAFSALEISQKLGINRTTVHRILAEFQAQDLVVQNGDKKFSIGPELYHLGSKYLYKTKGFNIIKQVVEKTAIQLKQNVGYTVIEKGKIMNLYESELTMPVKITYEHGSFFPIHCGAYGKTIMAFHKPTCELEQIVRHTDLIAKTEKTITDPDLLLLEYKKIRTQGYGISDEENMKGAFGIGVPVFKEGGMIHGCIGLAALKSSFDEQEVANCIKVLKRGAKEISKYVV
ncbi:IclR family transcriptional regulator [Fusibacter ferrireducens]|uniref:IclR family transcriptional regulator n=1 Tax=Fusibacter ferrireducens TaxID=2785058 RepID=A0ABR9ZYD9_9FIRM|nr:IclR family transcriptional regulator [Fusibacter ferrireducens]MBF4695488.1 IclR family transcriptional regulator [Fusibacter ferrireducens]